MPHVAQYLTKKQLGHEWPSCWSVYPAMKTTGTADTADTAVYQFSTSAGAWAFMRECDANGLAAGFPGLRDHTVAVLVPTWMARETADALAGREPVSYAFGRAS